MMTFAEKVRLARKQMGVTQQEFAKRLKVSFSTINRWEKGRHEPHEFAKCGFDDFCEKNRIYLKEQSEQKIVSKQF